MSTESIRSTNSTVVLTLRFRETILRPSIRSRVVTSLFRGQKEFLFNSEPRIMFFGFLHDLIDEISKVESGRGNLVINEGFT